MNTKELVKQMSPYFYILGVAIIIESILIAISNGKNILYAEKKLVLGIFLIYTWVLLKHPYYLHSIKGAIIPKIISIVVLSATIWGLFLKSESAYTYVPPLLVEITFGFILLAVNRSLIKKAKRAAPPFKLNTSEIIFLIDLYESKIPEVDHLQGIQVFELILFGFIELTPKGECTLTTGGRDFLKYFWRIYPDGLFQRRAELLKKYLPRNHGDDYIVNALLNRLDRLSF